MTDRAQVLEAIAERVAERGWRVRDDDEFCIVLLPPLARSRPERNRWPHEPEEGPEDHSAQEIIEHVARVADIDIQGSAGAGSVPASGPDSRSGDDSPVRPTRGER